MTTTSRTSGTAWRTKRTCRNNPDTQPGRDVGPAFSFTKGGRTWTSTRSSAPIAGRSWTRGPTAAPTASAALPGATRPARCRWARCWPDATRWGRCSASTARASSTAGWRTGAASASPSRNTCPSPSRPSGGPTASCAPSPAVRSCSRPPGWTSPTCTAPSSASPRPPAWRRCWTWSRPTTPSTPCWKTPAASLWTSGWRGRKSPSPPRWSAPCCSPCSTGWRPCIRWGWSTGASARRTSACWTTAAPG